MSEPLRTAAMIAVGSEMLGPTRVDTNSLKVTMVLERFGVALVRKSVVGDSLEDLSDEIRFALDRADLLLTSGGLGPTEDDLTREALAKALGLEFEVDQSIIDTLEARFRARGRVMAEANKKQANVFRGQTVLANERGTAPGFHLQVDGAGGVAKHVWVFPGVPHEIEWMIATYLVPWLEKTTVAGGRERRVLKVSGLTESDVEERLKPYYAGHPGEPLTILASPAGIELHVIGEGGPEGSRSFIASRERELLEIFGERLFGFDADTMESVVGALLTRRNETVATAESCSGGLLSSRITDVPGSSAYFMAGAVCYSADAKASLAGVDPQIIRENGEVSEPVALALARGIRERFGTTYGVGITGIAGPGGGSAEKPVGTIHIAVVDSESAEHRRFVWPSTRPLVKAFATQAALDLLRLFMLRRAGVPPASRGASRPAGWR